MRRSSTLAMLSTAALIVAACKPDAPRPVTPAGVASGARRYTVRGEIVQLSPGGEGSSEILLRHEPIDDFVDRSGRVVGMDSMVMPFLVRPPASVAGLAVGDRVSVRFALDWEGPTFTVERVERLPPDAALRFGPARPPGAGAR